MQISPQSRKLINSTILYKKPIKYSRAPESPSSTRCFIDITNTRAFPKASKKSPKTFLSSHIFTKSLTPKPSLHSSIKPQRSSNPNYLSKFNEKCNNSLGPPTTPLAFPVPPRILITHKSSIKKSKLKLLMCTRIVL